MLFIGCPTDSVLHTDSASGSSDFGYDVRLQPETAFINLNSSFMNKKFSTLVAGLLLAGAVGTANAATPSYVKYTKKGDQATTVQQRGAYQLTDQYGRVLSLRRVQTNGQYEYSLQMVSADDGVNLAETLWNITYSENKEGGPSFTFVSAPYGIPLSFTPKNIGTRDIIREYPGSAAVWKWQKSTSVTGSNSFEKLPLVNNYSAALDSAIVVIEDVDGHVAAKRYKTSDGMNSFASSVLNLVPTQVASVVLGADDLNSMMMTQEISKFKLTFNGEPQNAANGNIWTSQKYQAVPAIANSTHMYKPATTTGYNANQKMAAEAAWKAAQSLLEDPNLIANVVKTTSADAAVQAWVNTVKNTASQKETFSEALQYVTAELQSMGNDVAEVTNANDAAQAILAQVNAFPYAEQTGVANTAALLGQYIDAVTTENLGEPGQYATDFKNAFKALVSSMEANDEASYVAVKGAVDELVGKLTATNLTPDPAITSAEGLKVFYRGKGLTTEMQTLVESLIDLNSSYTGGYEAYAPYLAGVLEANAGKVAQALADHPFLKHIPALSFADFKTKLSEVVASQGLNEEAFGEVKDDLVNIIGLLPDATTTDAAKAVVTTRIAEYQTEADAVADYQTTITSIETSLNTVNSKNTVVTVVLHAADDMDAEARDIARVISEDVDGTDLVSAVNSVDVRDYFSSSTTLSNEIDPVTSKQYVSLYLGDKKVNNVDKKHYLAVDTNFVTGAAGRRHLKFASWYYSMPTKSDGTAMPTNLQRDYNGHFNFKFTYFPTQDSMVIVTDGYAMEPVAEVGVKNWVDMPSYMVEASHDYEGNGAHVMLAVLADNHSEVTVGKPQQVAGTNRETLNTRIGFNATVGKGAEIEAGVYTIQYVSEAADKKETNGRYIVANWLPEGQAIAKVEDQDLNHIPAAQWMLSHENGSNINTILNRESGDNLKFFQYDNSSLPVQYLYETATAGLYTTVYGDSLKLAKVDAEALKDSTLGYYAAAKYNEETNDQLNVYALKYLNNLASVFVNYTAADSILNVTAGDEAEVYFRLIPAAGAAKYGASNTALAKDLYRQAYRLQLETGKANVKDEDQLFVIVDANGKYRLDTRKKNTDGSLSWIGETTENAIAPFFLKEFKEGEDHSYALIEAYYNDDKVWEPGDRKISVKDYPSILITERLEGEMKGYYGYYMDGRTSTFMLTAKDAPKYRRLGVTDAEDGLKDNDTNYAKIYTTRNANRYLYENSLNKVAGYEEDPLGLNFLGDINTKEASKNLALFIDTAYVRNNTARPQYMIALRPDFTPDTVKCEAHPSTHPYDLVDAVHADYLVTLADSVKAYVKKTTQDKFKFDGYTRLAFVPAKHVGDEFTIANSIYTGTKNAAKDKKDLSKNGWNNGVWQFRLTGNDAEFYIEGAAENNFIRLVNGVAVVTTDIADAERFNIETTEEEATANEAVEAAEVSVVAAQGAIIVKGAAGKVVTVANILGQTIANQVAASDNVTIAAPAGIAVVTVDGEATKVVVK
ncbi:hypothetical protein JQM83_14350 [Parabacteroides distasonis]|nr:hypothetical protein [Parabacteroides distasonis]